MSKGIKLLRLDELRPHEAISRLHAARLAGRIRQDGCLKNPIVVDKKTRVILDGHHRVKILKGMGMKLVPAMVVDYYSAQVRVYLRRKELKMKLVKQAVIEKASKGEVFKHKTTRHLVKGRIRGVNVRLGKLR